MCCGSRICTLCTLLVLALIIVGFVFGFGVFKHGFHKLETSLHACDPSSSSSLCGGGRPFFTINNAPPPF